MKNKLSLFLIISILYIGLPASALQCSQLFKEPKITDLLTPENLKKYEFELEGSILIDTSHNNRVKVGNLIIDYSEKLYKWGSIGGQKSSLKNQDRIDDRMEQFIHNKPQAYGRGFYVSKQPIDSQRWGRALTIYKTDGPILLLDRENDIDIDSQRDPDDLSRTLRYSKLGIDAFQCTDTWLAMLTTKHLKNIIGVKIVEEP